ncbi:O-antigen ligase family protein [Flavobacterium limnosediminis]|uniref:O-antigen ligase family protein n=1 Tax=Flavobacterium limnosediminis TaxID=1401027 RepID=UPI0003F58782|nr:O-antigen ligase family protein [Flavobacterium limnosediminis]
MVVLSYFLVKKVNDFSLFLKTVVLVGFSMALIHISGIFLFGKSNTSINDLRGSFGLDNFIEIVSFYIVLFYRKTYKSSLVKNLFFETIIGVVLLISIYLYFSRTMLVSLILIGLSVFGYTKVTKNKLVFLGAFLVFLSLLYAYLFSVKIDRNGKGIEAFLYKVKIAPEEIFKTKIDRENHKDLWDHWRGYEAKRAFSLMDSRPISYMIGNGFGSLVDLKFTAPLDEKGMRYISRLHNGYVFVFYKTGVIGLFFYLYFIFLLIRKTNKEGISSYMSNRFTGSIGLFFLFTSLIISGIYIPLDLMLFLLGGFLSFTNREQVIVKAI